MRKDQERRGILSFGALIPRRRLQRTAIADARQLKDPHLGLSHNLGAVPYNGVCAVSISSAWKAASERMKRIRLL